MKRPVTLAEARAIVKQAKDEYVAREAAAHLWKDGNSIWCRDGKSAAVPAGPKKLTIIGTGHFATTVFVGQEIVSFINCRWDYFEHMSATWESRLDYERVPRNGHLVWQASLV